MTEPDRHRSAQSTHSTDGGGVAKQAGDVGSVCSQTDTAVRRTEVNR